ncbi:MAG: Rieske (2Fe-2S) protein [Bacteroidales bacterium]|nr:Rieske (2Fe-2S) protein [Bacteroidales bacterium]
MSENKNGISRRNFLKWLGWLMAIPYVFITGISIKRNNQINSKKTVRTSSNIAAGVTFSGQVILVKNNASVHIFSSRCTHLGCRINSLENDEIVCPCHGSRFDLEGNCIKGPANKPLKKFKFELDSVRDEYVIEL